MDQGGARVDHERALKSECHGEVPRVGSSSVRLHSHSRVCKTLFLSLWTCVFGPWGLVLQGSGELMFCGLARKVIQFQWCVLAPCNVELWGVSVLLWHLVSRLLQRFEDVHP